MILAAPLWLGLLPVVVVLFAIGTWQGSGTVGVPTIAGLRRKTLSWRVVGVRGLPWLRAVASIVVVLALARPQFGYEATEIVTEGIAIAMVVDVSSSMSALDLGGDEGQDRNRLDVVKGAFSDFVAGNDRLRGRAVDLVSLVSFGRYADLLTPPTLDHDTLLAMVEGLAPVNLPEEDGTALGDAILAGLDSLAETETSSRVVLVLTDGSHNAGAVSPLVAAEAARALDVRIYTIGAGSRGLARMPSTEDGGRERQVQVFIDEFTLTKVADIAEGQYFRATDETGLEAIYAEIDRLEKGRNVARHYQRSVDLYPWFLGLAIVLLLVQSMADVTVFRVAP